MSSKIVPVTRTPRGQARLAILDATLQVIACDGIDAVTHRRVAEIAGVSPGSTTHHFDSREDLLHHAFRRYLEVADRVIQALFQEMQAAESDPAKRVVELLCAMLDREFTDERMLRAEYEMMLFASGDEPLAAHLRAWEARWVMHLATDLELAGTPRPLEAARALLNLVRGFELERLIDRRLEIDEFRRRVAWVTTGQGAVETGQAS